MSNLHPIRSANPQCQCPRGGSKEMRLLLRQAWEAGCWIEQRASGGHFRILPPKGKPIVISSSPGGKRTLLNDIARLRQHGVDIPRKKDS